MKREEEALKIVKQRIGFKPSIKQVILPHPVIKQETLLNPHIKQEIPHVPFIKQETPHTPFNKQEFPHNPHIPPQQTPNLASIIQNIQPSILPNPNPPPQPNPPKINFPIQSKISPIGNPNFFNRNPTPFINNSNNQNLKGRRAPFQSNAFMEKSCKDVEMEVEDVQE